MTTEFGKRLKKARNYAGFNQKQLSSRAGITQGTLSDLENKASGSVNTASMAFACGVSALWLETGDGDMLEGVSAKSPTSKSERDLIAAYRAIKTQKNKGALLGYAADLVESESIEVNESSVSAGHTPAKKRA